jgi:hypothetical protein
MSEIRKKMPDAVPKASLREMLDAGYWILDARYRLSVVLILKVKLYIRTSLFLTLISQNTAD